MVKQCLDVDLLDPASNFIRHARINLGSFPEYKAFLGVQRKTMSLEEVLHLTQRNTSGYTLARTFSIGVLYHVVKPGSVSPVTTLDFS